MGTTDAVGIYKYDHNDGAPTATVLNIGQQSVSDTIASIGQYYRVANATERTAIYNTVGASTAKPLLVYRENAREGFRFEYTTNGVDWVPMNQSGMDPADMFFTQSGTHVGQTNINGQIRVTYPTAFTTRINSFVACAGDVAGGLAIVAIDDPFNTDDVASLRLKCYTATGGLVRNMNVRINWIATGY